MGALWVALERREPSNSGMEFVEIMRCRQIMNIGENLKTFNFDLGQTLIHRIHGRVVGGCVVVRGAGGGIDRHRGQAVAKRVHPRTRFAFLTAGPRLFAPLRRFAAICRCDAMGTYFRDADTAASRSAMAFSAARSARAWAFEVVARSSRYLRQNRRRES